MPAQVPAGGGARHAVALAITQAHVHVVDLGGGVAAAARTRRLEGRAFSLEDVLGAPERVTMACWAAPRTACFPLRSGDVCALRVGDEAGDSSFVALRDVAGKTRLFGGGAAAPVVALAACGEADGAVVAAARADWRLSLWAAATGALRARVALAPAAGAPAAALGPATVVAAAGADAFALFLDCGAAPAAGAVVGADGAAGARPAPPAWPGGRAATCDELEAAGARGGTLWSAWRRRGDGPAGTCLVAHDLATGVATARAGGARARAAAADGALRARRGDKSWAALFGHADWARASAALEAHWLRRLRAPGRASAAALRRTVAHSLPRVPRRDGQAARDGDALDACLEAARDGYRRSPAARGASFEDRCDALCAAWARVLALADAQALADARPLGFVDGAAGLGAAPPCVLAAGLAVALPAAAPPDAAAWPRALAAAPRPPPAAHALAAAATAVDAASAGRALIARVAAAAAGGPPAAAAPSAGAAAPGDALRAAARAAARADVALARACRAAVAAVAPTGAWDAAAVAAVVDAAVDPSGSGLLEALRRGAGAPRARARAPSRVARRALVAAAAARAAAAAAAAATLAAVALCAEIKSARRLRLSA